MPRTPILRTIQRFASAHDDSTTPVANRRRPTDQGLKRRELLAGMGGAAVASCLPSSRVVSAQSRGAPRIAVVGAGIGGLSAALTLADAGVAPIVYEASDQVGGRMRSDTTTFANGQVVEACGEFVDSWHTTIRSLALRFDLRLVDVEESDGGADETYHFLGAYYPIPEVDRDFRPVYDTLRAQYRATPFRTAGAMTPEGHRLDRLSVYEWIDAYIPGGHKSKLGALLNVAYLTEFGRDTTDQSSLSLLYLLGSVPTTSFNLYGGSDEKYRFVGGSHRLPQAIADSLPQGTIERGHRLVAIGKNGDGTVKLTFATGGGTKVVSADHVILAIPFSILRGIDYRAASFDAGKQAAIAQLGYGTTAKLHLQFSERFWERAGPWGKSTGASYADAGYQCTWDSTRGQPGATGILTGFTGGKVAANYAIDSAYATTHSSSKVSEYALRFLSQIERVFPGIRASYTGVASLSCPNHDPNFQASYPIWLVGQYTAFAGRERDRHGNIHFAGEHCSTAYLGYMEGAAEEGQRAGREILGDLGVRAVQ